MNRNTEVIIEKIHPKYPDAPYSPSQHYPEYQFQDILPIHNEVYNSIRNILFKLGYDKENFGSSIWNPFEELIKHGDTVFIKPNLVNSYHFTGGNIQSVITHSSILRALIDYIIIALGGSGNIIIGDSPERVAIFTDIIRISGLTEIENFYKKNGVSIQILDLRREHISYGFGAITNRTFLSGDPKGYTKIDLGHHSCFDGLPELRLKKLYGADYNRKETLMHHTKNKHIYEISNSILHSDVIISIPKLKTHQKAGVTLNLKGLIGCTGNKNLIPHRSIGDPTTLGDTYTSPASTARGCFYRFCVDFLKDNLLGRCENKSSAIIYSLILNCIARSLFIPKIDKEYIGGGWYGNDTLWRSVCDIYYLTCFTDKNGILRSKPQKKFFSVVDGIVAGERNGPLEPETKKEGLLIAGSDLLSVDMACTRLMGFDPTKIKYLQKSMHQYNIDQKMIKLKSNFQSLNDISNITRENSFNFRPPDRWKGKIEL